MLVVSIRRLNQRRPDDVTLRNEHTAGLQQAAAGINDGWNGLLVERQNTPRIGH